MAIKRIVTAIVILAAVVTAAILQYSRNIKSKQATIEDGMFVGTYVDLAVARELYINSPDSFILVQDLIFSSYGTDSSWMENHVRSFGRDADRRQRIWEEIVDSLQAMTKGPLPETIRMFQSASAVNADSI